MRLPRLDPAMASRILLVLLIVSLVSIAVLAYKYNEAVGEKQGIISSLGKSYAPALYRLHGDIDILLDLVNKNVSTCTIRYLAEAIAYTASDLSTVARILYDYTGDMKYYNISVGFGELEAFLHGVCMRRSDEIRIIIVENNETLKEIGHVAFEMAREGGIVNAPSSLAAELRTYTSHLELPPPR